jgi:hypothetical protein
LSTVRHSADHGNGGAYRHYYNFIDGDRVPSVSANRFREPQFRCTDASAVIPCKPCADAVVIRNGVQDRWFASI